MYQDPEERETQIRNMSAGFRELADGILPELRRSRLIINYETIGRSDDQIKEQYTTDASKLSADELLYAAALEDNAEKKEDIYKKTAELYPNDSRAFNNIAALEFAKGNNELQNYVADGMYNGVKIAEVSDGTLKITAQKIGGKVQSVRMNTKESWTYGYFEARLKLPKGKGTWPAFWMMPKNYHSWPADGEIDIMEEVGYNPEYVSSSIHCTAYNHPKNTQKTHEFLLKGAQSEFHTYALEWTAEKMDFIFDGEVHLTFKNDGKGNYDTWPFNNPFYLKLNLAWGGDWGGAMGFDESCLPATYEIDYVRVFQKQ